MLNICSVQNLAKTVSLMDPQLRVITSTQSENLCQINAFLTSDMRAYMAHSKVLCIREQAPTRKENPLVGLGF